MSDSDYKYSYSSGPFYRKFMAGDNVWCEVDRDGKKHPGFYYVLTPEGEKLIRSCFLIFPR